MSIEFRKDLFADERDDNLKEVGKPTRRQDILGHVTGRSPYYDDHLFDGLCHIRCVRSPHHAARIRHIDAGAAERMPGVVRIIWPSDVPRNLNTLLSLLDFGKDDEPLLAPDQVRYRGEPVLAIIAETERQARDAVAAVRVDWEVLPHVLDVEAALAPGAPVVNAVYPGNAFEYHKRYNHQKLRFGDVEAGFREAAHVVEGRYSMSPIEQAPIETCGAIAAPEQNDRYVCHTSTQALFFSLGTAAKLLNVGSNRLHFIGGTVGGGFGGKVDSLHEPMALLGAILTGRPCKFQFDRAEEMQVGAPRGAEVWYLKDGIAADGRLLARRFVGYFDSGAYTRLSSYAVQKATGHLPGPYTIPNVYSDVFCVYTNRTPATAMRGFGITGVDWAIERHMDKVARAVGMDPMELRILNAYRDGDMKAHRRVAKNCALVECAQVAAEKAGWPLSANALAASSLTGGGGLRGALPAATATDQIGRIGPEDGRPVAPLPAAVTERAGPAPRQPHPAPAPERPAQTQSRPTQGAPGGAPSGAPPATPGPTPPQQPQPPLASPEPYRPAEPFSRGVRRPGTGRFSSLSGTRRR
ncbi:MAG: molybdopterin cofactor-binding domain-containing protein [Pseudomonadota bacterium]